MDEPMTDPLPTWIDEVTKPNPVAMDTEFLESEFLVKTTINGLFNKITNYIVIPYQYEIDLFS
jgi:hypothetical protein